MTVETPPLVVALVAVIAGLSGQQTVPPDKVGIMVG
jgi:hypothetical protein